MNKDFGFFKVTISLNPRHYKFLHGCDLITPSNILRQYWKEWTFVGNDTEKYKTILNVEKKPPHSFEVFFVGSVILKSDI